MPPLLKPTSSCPTQVGDGVIFGKQVTDDGFCRYHPQGCPFSRNRDMEDEAEN